MKILLAEDETQLNRVITVEIKCQRRQLKKSWEPALLFILQQACSEFCW